MESRPWMTIVVGSVQVPVVRRPRTDEEANDGDVGGFDRLRIGIWVWDELPPDAAKQTLAHEIVHAVIFIFGMQINEDDDERVACSVGAHAFDVLTRNSMLVIPDPPQ